MIHEEFGGQIDELNAEELTLEKLQPYENLIFGVPTWFDGELPNYWDEFVPELEEADLRGKSFALYGAGRWADAEEAFAHALHLFVPETREDAIQLREQFLSQLCRRSFASSQHADVCAYWTADEARKAAALRPTSPAG